MNSKNLVIGGVMAAIAAGGVGGFLLLSKPQLSAAELAEKAISDMKALQYDQARDEYIAALEKDPKNERALYGAGQLALKEKRLKAAENYLRRAYEVNPKNIQVILTLGATYHEGGAYAKAEQLYLAVRQAEPKNSAAVYNLGMAEIGLKKLEKARGYFIEYLAMEPKAPDRQRVIKKIALIDAHLKERAEIKHEK